MVITKAMVSDHRSPVAITYSTIHLHVSMHAHTHTHMYTHTHTHMHMLIARVYAHAHAHARALASAHAHAHAHARARAHAPAIVFRGAWGRTVRQRQEQHPRLLTRTVYTFQIACVWSLTWLPRYSPLHLASPPHRLYGRLYGWLYGRPYIGSDAGRCRRHWRYRPSGLETNRGLAFRNRLRPRRIHRDSSPPCRHSYGPK